MRTTILILGILAALPASAEGFRSNTPYPADYKAECGSCHDPFPPGMLNRHDWGAVMGSLDKHYGTDASLDDKTAAGIRAWLEQHAGRRANAGGTPPRFTTSRWFKREHREVPASSLQALGIKSPTQCSGCHKGAAKGNFDENEIVIPGRGRYHEDD